MGKKDHPNPSFIRRKYLINQGFQIRFIAYTVIIALTVILTVFLTSNYFFWTFQERGREIGLTEGHVFFLFLDQQKAVMNQLLVMLSIFYFFGLSIFGLVFSHRVAGPMYRLHKHMSSVSKGEITSPVSFRKHDYFQELASSYNAQYEYLKYGISSNARRQDENSDSVKKPAS